MDQLRVLVAGRPDDETVDEFVASLRSGAERAGRSVEVDVCAPPSAPEMVDQVAERVADHDVIAAVGGDGTLNLVAGALVRSRRSDLAAATASTDVGDARPSMVSVPSGTVNLAAGRCGIESVEDAVDATLGGATWSIDVGSAGGRPFLLNASSGFDAQVIDDADDHSGTRLGRLHFVIEAFRRLRSWRPTPVDVLVDGETAWSGRAMSVVVLNFPERGSSSLSLVEGAADDGRFDVVVVRAETITRLAAGLVRMIRGRRPSTDDAVVLHGQRVDVRWSRPVATQRDGDADDAEQIIEHRLEPRAIDLVVHSTAS